MLVLWKALNRMHMRTSQCTQGEERRRRRLAEEEEIEVTNRVFRAYGHHLEMVTSSKYLGQMISETDDD